VVRNLRQIVGKINTERQVACRGRMIVIIAPQTSS
jgi:hypothetical protein